MNFRVWRDDRYDHATTFRTFDEAADAAIAFARQDVDASADYFVVPGPVIVVLDDDGNVTRWWVGAEAVYTFDPKELAEEAARLGGEPGLLRLNMCPLETRYTATPYDPDAPLDDEDVDEDWETGNASDAALVELVLAAREMLRGGEHEGECDPDDCSEACDLHWNTARARREHLKAALEPYAEIPTGGGDGTETQDEDDGYRRALDAILALCGRNPRATECLNDPDFGETVRQAVAMALKICQPSARSMYATTLLRAFVDAFPVGDCEPDRAYKANLVSRASAFIAMQDQITKASQGDTGEGT